MNTPISRENTWLFAAGMVLFVLAAIVFYFVWVTSSALSGEFLAALAGAVVAGIVTWIVQFISMQAAQAERKQERAQSNQALGRAIAFKMMKIYSNILKLHQHVEGSFQEARERSFTGEPWQIVLPLANFPPHVDFSVEEMSLILSFGDDQLLNSLLSVDSIHNSDIDIMRKFSDMREELTNQLPAQMTGNIGTNYLTAEQLAAVRPRMVEINMIIERMRPQLRRDQGEALAILTRLEGVLRDRLGFRFRMTEQSDG